jgi:hypothetical protein
MRRILMAGLLVLLALGAPTVVAAQSVHVSAAALAKIKAILATYPDGGPQLQAAIAAVVEADPTLASAVVLAAQTATTLQQQELGLGLAEAAAVLQDTGTPAGIAAANEIAQAVAIGPPALLAEFTLASGTTVAPLAGGLNGSANLTTNACVSPSAAGARCSP